MNIKNDIFTTLILVFFLTGCAKSAADISPVYISPIKYQNYSCSQVGEEMIRVSREVNRISDRQNGVVAKDTIAITVGLVIFWPALFGLVGGDEEEELSQLKGMHDALEITANYKQCSELLLQIEEERGSHEMTDNHAGVNANEKL